MSNDLSVLKGVFIFGALRAGADVFLVCGHDTIYRLAGVTGIANSAALHRAEVRSVDGPQVWTSKGLCVFEGSPVVDKFLGAPPADVQPLVDF